MKFDYIVGNPPYQDDSEGENNTFAMPIYHIFLDAVYKLADKVEMIHPARFLFNVGSTPKEWNRKMLDDPHLKLMHYFPDSSTVFKDTDIMGGIAITYRDVTRKFEPIKIFTPSKELNSILKKVSDYGIDSIKDVIYTQNKFNLDILYKEYPEFREVIGSNGADKRFRNNIFEKISIFHDNKNENDIKVLGISKNKRIWKYIDKKYVDCGHENLSKYKVLVPAANGSGALGEVIPTPLIGLPLIAPPMVSYTQSFIGIGSFDNSAEAESLLKYLKSKFCRVMLGILKVTQHNDKDVWQYVPLQDFTANSDIDWSKSIPEIDRQLYKKYGLDESEIKFIESHVKEME